MKNMIKKTIFIGMILIGQSLKADVKLPALFGDNMLLQANKPVPVWGTADAGEKVTVSFAGQKVSSTADANGKWQIKLNPLAINTAGIMTVEGKNQIRINNVLVGTVWICSGQSNMEIAIVAAGNAVEEISKAHYPKIRLFKVERAASFQPLADVRGQWLECNPENLGQGGRWGGFSAVGYFFGRELHRSTGLPVGMIASSWGGTPAEAWTSLAGLQKEPELKDIVQRYTTLINDLPTLKAKFQKDASEYSLELKAWQDANQANQAKLSEWEAAVNRARQDGKPLPPKPLPGKPAPKPLEQYPPDQKPHPTFLYNAMIAPLVPYAMEGVIWYQGESNAYNAEQAKDYKTLFPALIADWRSHWGMGDFPFYYCQLANFKAKQPLPDESCWADLREAQRLTLRLPNTGMAVLIDVGEAGDIHPINKQEVGARLAKIALAKLFGKEVRFTGPVYRSMKVEGSKIRLSFDSVGGELVARELPATYDVSIAHKETKPLVRNRPGSQLEGFAICGADRKWVWADAAIERDTVVVSAPEVQEPVAVRYAWADNPTCNLFNKEGLPASPFQTEDGAETSMRSDPSPSAK